MKKKMNGEKKELPSLELHEKFARILEELQEFFLANLKLQSEKSEKREEE